MKELKFLCVQPSDKYFIWQVHLWIESLKKLGHSNKAIVLIYVPFGRNNENDWQKVINLYPEAQFVFYKDVNKDITHLLNIYIPVLRPYCLMKYFKDNPQMENNAIFYCDCDVIFTDKFNINEFTEDDVCYLSNTNSYINASYFDSKVKDVLPNKLNDYKSIDVLEKLTSIVGINRTIAESNNLHSGGAQYLLKNVNSEFWEKVMKDCITLRTEMLNINKQFFQNENKGIQSWCSDMWSVLWNIWMKGYTTKVIPEMNFAWSTDSIEKLKTHTILHNAGIVSEKGNGYPAFYKGKYIGGSSPFNDGHLQVVYENEESKKKCTHYYVSELLNIKNKYNLNY